MIQVITGICEYEGCDRDATAIASGRERYDGKGHWAPGKFCDTHARLVEDEGRPECSAECPNCGCRFGVG
jgi:hypothetical protein